MTATDNNNPASPMLKLYEFISGPADLERPWTQIASLFLPGARLRMEIVSADGSVRSSDWSVDEFAKDAAIHYRREGFWEKEIASRIDQFGNIAHVFSVYETRIGDKDSPPVVRGINSVQMLKRNGQWKIAGIVFQMEQPDLPIPREYLKNS
jgi:hypothetical protein